MKHCLAIYILLLKSDLQTRSGTSGQSAEPVPSLPDSEGFPWILPSAPGTPGAQALPAFRWHSVPAADKTGLLPEFPLPIPPEDTQTCACRLYVVRPSCNIPVRIHWQGLSSSSFAVPAFPASTHHRYPEMQYSHTLPPVSLYFWHVLLPDFPAREYIWSSDPEYLQ